MADYKKVRCIAFQIKPGPKEIDPNDASKGKVYVGSGDAEKDIQKRCAIMKDAVNTAYSEVEKCKKKPVVNVAKGKSKHNSADSEDVLTVFMAPEFFFRGADGAYPLEEVETILPKMAKVMRSDPVQKEEGPEPPAKQKEARAAWEDKKYEDNAQFKKFKDWLFVYGTAIGYLDEDKTKITRVVRCEKSGNDTVVHVDSLSAGSVLNWIAAIRDRGIKSTIKAENTRGPVKAGVKEVERLVGNNIEVTLDAPVAGGYQGEYVQFIRPDNSKTESIQVSATQPPDKITLTMPRKNTCPSCGCARFELESEQNFMLMQGMRKQRRLAGYDDTELPVVANWSDYCKNCAKSCSHTHTEPVESGWKVISDGGSITLTGDLNMEAGDLMHLSPSSSSEKTEVFNVALIQKGSMDLIVYKENISGIDYIKAPNNKNLIHGENRKLIQTEKSGQTSEKSESGLGGQSVFTVENCTIGLEICLDHKVGRLKKFYRSPGAAGEKKPQLLLIPSWGMSIGGGPEDEPATCLDNALIFNVDGQRGDSTVRIFDGTYRCEDDPKLKSNTEDKCPECMRYYCPPPCNKIVSSKDGKTCPECGHSPVLPAYRCKSCEEWSSAAGICPKCKVYACSTPTCKKPVHTADGQKASGCEICGNTALYDYYRCDCKDSNPWLINSNPCSCGKQPKMFDPRYELYEKKLQNIGSLVQPIAGPKTINLSFWDWLTVTQTNYFLEEGSIVIYPEQPIPGT